MDESGEGTNLGTPPQQDMKARQGSVRSIMLAQYMNSGGPPVVIMVWVLYCVFLDVGVPSGVHQRVHRLGWYDLSVAELS